ncbi:MAG: efflux RND transporter permease subunit [Candidatus Omnitrophica bacterium]|nr:efflux RND transporter permease subunit [Candidatus Omnitrophota bacterium]
MNLPEFGVRRPVTVSMIFLGIIILGLVSLSRLGLDMMPEIEIPAVGVFTTYSGAGPEEIEKRITEKLEERLSTIPNLDEITSISREGTSIVNLALDWGANIDEASNDVRDYVGITKRELPDDAEDPLIFKFDFSMMPIMVMGVTADESFPRLQKIVEDKVADPLKRIPGVATAVARGGLERQILVEVDSSRLKARHLSVDQVNLALRLQNLTLPSGHLATGLTDYLVRIPEEFKSVEDIENTIVAMDNGTPIYLKDVAAVKDSFAERTQFALVNRREGLRLIVQKQSGANTVEVVDRVLKELPRLQEDLPSDVKIEVIRDFAEFIRLSINTLSNSLLWGSLLVVIIILFFLRRISSSFIVVSAIPCSLIITFILMYMSDYTLNMISLSSLAIALGMVVDAAIVVSENIHRHHERLKSPPDLAAIEGGSEVSKAVIASTLTTMAIFLPIIFVKGITGILFKQMAAVICLALFASLFTALTLIPMLSSKLLKFGINTNNNSKTSKKNLSLLRRFYKVSENWFTKTEQKYSELLAWTLSHRKTTVFFTVLLLAFSLALIFLVGTEFFPEVDSGMIRMDIERPIGTRVSETGKVINAIEDIVYESVPEIDAAISTWGYGQVSGMSSILGGEESSNTGYFMGKLVQKKFRTRSNKEIAAALKPMVSSFAGTEVRFSTEDPLESMLFGSSSKPLTIEVRGYDLDDAREYCTQIAKALEGIKGVGDIEISRKEGKPELQIAVDRDKASRLGVNITELANTIRTFIDGKAATQYREGGDEYDIYVRLRPEDRSDLLDLDNLFVTSGLGRQIRLSNIASVLQEKGPLKIERKGQERIVYVSANIYGRDLGHVVAEAKQKLEQVPAPEGFSYSFSGAREEQIEAFQWLSVALILGVLLVYMVMASLFESFKHPFVILFSIPFAMIGVIWALLLTNQRLNVDSFIGIILLTGIVVNNAIVLIDYVNILRRKGADLFEAIQEAGRTRLRPVLMTALTTIVGLLPLALFQGEGAEEWRALATAVIGGLAVSTLITLVFIPTLYSLFETKIRRK